MKTTAITNLTAPFALEQVRQRKGNFGQQLSYVEANTVIFRLNEALEGAWSFVVVETIIEQDEVIVRGRLTIDDSIREQFGGSKITRHKDSGDAISLADDLKAATSDCLKKCATLAGVGLYLYTEQPEAAKANGNQKRTGSGSDNGHRINHISIQGGSNRTARKTSTPGPAWQDPDRVTDAGIARIFDAARDIGLQQKEVIAMARDNFDTTISQLTPTQADDLIALIGQAA